MTRALLALAALGAGLALVLLRPAARTTPRQCAICGRELPDDPLDVAPVCSWHWGVGGDA